MFDARCSIEIIGCAVVVESDCCCNKFFDLCRLRICEVYLLGVEIVLDSRQVDLLKIHLWMMFL